MTISRITSKGQTTVPKEVREKLRLQAGAKIDWDVQKDGSVRVEARNTRPSELLGILSSRTHVKSTIREMDEAVRDAFRKGKFKE